MIRVEVQQGTTEWFHARLGIPTASCFDKILTPKTMKPSSSAVAYERRLLSEWVLGRSIDDGSSPWMDRGAEMELEAVGYYELDRNMDTEQVGFILRDDRMVGCSPDRLVGTDGLLEIKCPKIETHMGYFFGDQPVDYRCQLQGQLWITGREWVDFLSYNPRVDPVVIRVARDEKFIKTLEAAVNGFVDHLQASRQALLDRGVKPGPVVAPGDPRSLGKAMEEGWVREEAYT